jgi:hypothetical protein
VNTTSQASAPDAFEATLFGLSPAMGRVLEDVVLTAKTPAHITICGEPGTGREMLAREIHRRTGSTERPFHILTGIAILVMACSLVWTMSRSGIAGAGVAATIMTATAVYRAKRRALRWALAGYLLFIVAAVVAWRGTDTLANWYGNTSTLEWRIDLWKDTLPALEDFWVTGSGLNTYGTLMLAYPRAG